jgi:general transcription factor 3C polypeptide 2
LSGDDKALVSATDPPPKSNEESNATMETSHEDGDNCHSAFPPKLVALHKVRWNKNKGTERWLCYGGASGMVRLQKISFGS